jgi:hypothetical protein
MNYMQGYSTCPDSVMLNKYSTLGQLDCSYNSAMQVNKG